MNDDIGTLIRDQFTKLLEQNVDRKAILGAEGAEMSPQLWRRIEEAGIPLALVPEEQGGAGLTAVAAFDLIATAAYHALPLPVAETIVVAALLGRPVEGPATFARLTEFGAARVAYGADARQILCAQGGDWFVVPAANVEARRGMNLAGEARDDLLVSRGDGEKLAVPDWLGPEGLDAAGALIRAAQMRGAMQRAVDMSLTHAGDREQFGRPIGKFQAVQHMLADAAGQLVAAGALVDNAAEAWGHADFGFRAALAKSRAGTAAGKVAEVAHQVHAAMGFTQDHDLNFYTRRLWSWRDEFGSEAVWQERIGRAVCAQGGGALWAGIISATASVTPDVTPSVTP
jgi:acyl-CoA dehydrogenase